MIIACPDCQTRFQVDDSALASSAGGRRLRCASCGHVWSFAAPSIEPEDAIGRTAAAPAAAAASREEPGFVRAAAAAATEPAAPLLSAAEREQRIEPRLGEPIAEGPREIAAAAENAGERQRIEPFASEMRLEAPTAPADGSGPVVMPRPSVAAAAKTESRAARHYWPVVGGVALTALVAASLLVAIFARERVMAVWPATTSLYASLDLVPPPGTGLEVTLSPSRTADSLVVDGNIVNGAKEPRPVPRLRLTLRDGNRVDLVSQVINPPVPRLLPGASAHFSAVFDHPSVAATKVDVTFSAD